MEHKVLHDLIEKYANGSATELQKEALLTWYRKDIAEVEWPAEHPDEKSRLKQQMFIRLQHQIRPSKIHRKRKVWQLVASIFMAISILLIGKQYLNKLAGSDYTTITNPSGKLKLVLLPDGTKVWMNASSSLRYLSSFKAKREVHLIGEGYFDVVHDSLHPFVVQSGALRTTVLGTSFDVKFYPGDRFAYVTVIRGKVKVQQQKKTLGVLNPSAELLLDNHTGGIKITQVDPNQVSGWSRGLMEFSGKTLEEISMSLGRWYNVRFIFPDAGLGAARYYLKFNHKLSLNEILAIMTETTGLVFKTDLQHRIIMVTEKR
ncbi:FecR family protein [Pedobacter nutrimenti]|jgi:ferric-dicitrate binding protein FerR (iron transport regulator)|uniref:FecR family protein n=1 Tax=Pedobacter nutrimenti TaxID=1241337 RepID=A0A318U9Y5_9SPHI|nr:FecR domain-containing protein [Pedobacter nutrimenti]PYF68996.1 FecR family protein [Pedobacter nutrimenti]